MNRDFQVGDRVKIWYPEVNDYYYGTITRIFFVNENGRKRKMIQLDNDKFNTYYCEYVHRLDWQPDKVNPMTFEGLLEVVTSKVPPKEYVPKVFIRPSDVKGKSTFLNDLINAVAQYRVDKEHGYGTWEHMTQEERLKEYNISYKDVVAIRDLGHLYN